MKKFLTLMLNVTMTLMTVYGVLLYLSIWSEMLIGVKG